MPISRRLILQQAHGHPLNRTPIACKLMVSCSISLPSRGSFHLSLAVLFAIGHTGVFSLTRWSSLIHTEFHVLHATRDSARLLQFSTTGLSPPLVHLSNASSNLYSPRCCPTTPMTGVIGLGSSRFARRYSGNRVFFLFLQLLRCFNSLGSLFRTWGCPIRKSSDQCLLPTPRSVSPVTASFFASVCLGIHHEPLVA